MFSLEKDVLKPKRSCFNEAHSEMIVFSEAALNKNVSSLIDINIKDFSFARIPFMCRRKRIYSNEILEVPSIHTTVRYLRFTHRVHNDFHLIILMKGKSL